MYIHLHMEICVSISIKEGVSFYRWLHALNLSIVKKKIVKEIKQ